MAYSDRELLARLIQCEAGGEGEIGMKAVAGVVMNRVNATAASTPGWVREASATSSFSPINLCAPVRRKMAYIILKISTICGPNRFTMTLPTGRSRETGYQRWRIRCGSTTPSAPPAAPGFHQTWGTGRPGSATIAFITPQMLITKLERCHYGKYSE